MVSIPVTIQGGQLLLKDGNLVIGSGAGSCCCNNPVFVCCVGGLAFDINVSPEFFEQYPEAEQYANNEGVVANIEGLCEFVGGTSVIYYPNENTYECRPATCNLYNGETVVVSDGSIKQVSCPTCIGNKTETDLVGSCPEGYEPYLGFCRSEGSNIPECGTWYQPQVIIKPK